LRKTVSLDPCCFLITRLLSRRRFLKFAAASLPLFAYGQGRAAPIFATRGVVLMPDDFSLPDWPERLQRAGLTTLALHHSTSVGAVLRFVRSEPGQNVLAHARQLGLHIEYELHALSDLLPRALFEKDKSLFRADESGKRTADFNLCVHSQAALEIVARNAIKIARLLRPTTGRYFLWGDDGHPWCHCEKCRGFSDSEQALMLENAMVVALREDEPNAQLAHLAYSTTLKAPKKVKPHPGVFLEYAPIRRSYDLPYAQQRATNDGLINLDENLTVFPAATAQVLEYWLDVSRFSDWKRPAKKLPWSPAVFRADLETYARRGIRHVTSFAVFIDADYVRLHGEPEALSEYGAGLREFALK
jgi:hypothetical protein